MKTGMSMKDNLQMWVDGIIALLFYFGAFIALLLYYPLVALPMAIFAWAMVIYQGICKVIHKGYSRMKKTHTPTKGVTTMSVELPLRDEDREAREDYRTIEVQRNSCEALLRKEKVKNQELITSIEVLREELDELQQSINDFHDALGDII